MNDLAVRESAELTPEQQKVESPLQILSRLIQTPGLGIDVAERMLAMQERMIAAKAKEAFNAAMVECQAEMQSVVRSLKNQQTGKMYADLERMDVQIRPIYTRFGLALTFSSPKFEGKDVTVTAKCMHRLGHSEDYALIGALDNLGPQGKPNKTDIQGLGSTISYLQKYLTKMIFNVTFRDEDKDGEKPQKLSDDELAKLEAMVQESGITETGLKNMLAVGGVARLEDVKPGAQYAGVYEALRMKLAARRQA